MAQHFGAADETILWFKRSKTDQEGAGAARNHYRAGGEVFPVWAAECYNVHFPSRILAHAAGGHGSHHGLRRRGLGGMTRPARGPSIVTSHVDKG